MLVRRFYLFVISFALLLSGCGTKGGLYLPKQPPEQSTEAKK